MSARIDEMMFNTMSEHNSETPTSVCRELEPQAHMFPVHYRFVGQYDLLFEVTLEANGEYVIHRGSYASAAPARGRLSRRQRAAMADALQRINSWVLAPMPRDADGFVSELRVGNGAVRRELAWWGARPPAGSDLLALVDVLRGLTPALAGQ